LGFLLPFLNYTVKAIVPGFCIKGSTIAVFPGMFEYVVWLCPPSPYPFRIANHHFAPENYLHTNSVLRAQ
jgi:hypothetical protein